LPYLFTRPFVVYCIPTRRSGETVRALVYNHPSRCSRLETGRKRPLHIDIHGGGFIGGIPEYDTPFCQKVAETTCAVVVSVTYRFAPRYPFPAAHDDIEDALEWLLENAEREFEADPKVLTISGFSAGGNLALGVTLGNKTSRGKNAVKGVVTFYSPVDLRLPPQNKRKPPGFPSIDPLWFLFPLFDAYAGPSRIKNIGNPRLHPTLISSQDWASDALFIIPTMDILLYEQLELVERLQSETAEERKKETSKSDNMIRIEKLVLEGQWHGWIELPSWLIDGSDRRKAFKAACDFLIETHQKHGFESSHSHAL
ncbi:MAG: hypothetical protein Q9181_002823, partial [Wetmoreana brouardii]